MAVPVRVSVFALDGRLRRHDGPPISGPLPSSRLPTHSLPHRCNVSLLADLLERTGGLVGKLRRAFGHSYAMTPVFPSPSSLAANELDAR
jgi:hypothetical protein